MWALYRLSNRRSALRSFAETGRRSRASLGPVFDCFQDSRSSPWYVSRIVKAAVRKLLQLYETLARRRRLRLTPNPSAEVADPTTLTLYIDKYSTDSKYDIVQTLRITVQVPGRSELASVLAQFSEAGAKKVEAVEG